MSGLEPIPYSDGQLRTILERVKTIAMVGASSNWNRPSYFVMKYLQNKGYRVIPVNPGIAGQTLLGEKVYASLRDIPEPVDMVDMFRAAREAPAVVEDAIAIGAKIVWMQLGIRNDAAAVAADLPDCGICVRRCRPRRLAVQPAQFRLHLCAVEHPDGVGARRAGREPR